MGWHPKPIRIPTTVVGSFRESVSLHARRRVHVGVFITYRNVLLVGVARVQILFGL